MEQKQELEILKEREEDSKWFQEKIDTIRKKYNEKFVAIKNKDIIVADKNLDIVIKKIEEKRENPSFILIEFVYNKDFKLII